MVKIKDDVYEIMHQDRRVARIDKQDTVKFILNFYALQSLF